MLARSFRLKLLLAMMAVVVGVTGATFYVAQSRFEQTYAQLYSRLFRAQHRAFLEQQHAILNIIQQTCRSIVGSRRLQFAMRALQEGGTPDDLDKQAYSEFDTRKILQSPGEDAGSSKARFYLFVDADGDVLQPAERALPGLRPLDQQTRLRQQLSRVKHAFDRMKEPLAGYLTPEDSAGQRILHQAIFTRIEDARTGEILGAMILGFPMPRFGAEGRADAGIHGGIWFEDELFVDGVAAAAEAELAKEIRRHFRGARETIESFAVDLGGEPHRVFIQPLTTDPDLPRGYLAVGVSLQEAVVAQRELRWRVMGFGGIGLVLALFVSGLLSHGLSVPIRELVAGTREIRQGNFDVRVAVRSHDEVGQLTGSFNEMAEGLAQKEKYRSVLDKVADPQVAAELMGGSVALGGEEREISVLFCDIRGFTALTQGMAPAEVVRMLNEHFTPLTRVVNEHYGVVDKFVGDLIMAVFGAPKSYGNDARNAAGCALAMIHERRKLNETSRYQIEMGIGLASGPALAGCMGSENRLNYTVLGERVNLASRLCSKAGRMEVVIDETTRRKLGTGAAVTPLADLELKGFTGKVPAFRLANLAPTRA